MQYQYTPLSDNKSIRIVTLLPGNSWSPIKCLIEEEKLDNILTPYWALSYVCGTPDLVASIWINGLHLPVARNLHTALWHIRRRYKDLHDLLIGNSPRPIRIWIDAICISQADVEERSQQVQLMKQIFEQAEHVVAWLGTSDQHSDRAFRKLVQLRTWYDQKAQALNYQDVNRAVITTVSRSDEAIFGCQTGPLDLGEWRSLKIFFQRDYWKRTWIVQENTSKAPTSYMCGGNVISASNLDVAVIIFSGCMIRPGFETLVDASGIQEAMRRYNLQQKRRRLEELNFVQVVNYLRRYDASDPRDKIYAGIGLVTHFTPGTMKVDYRLNVVEVYIELVRHTIDTDQNLDILAYATEPAPIPQGISSILGQVPSWCPDWSRFERRVPFEKQRRSSGSLEDQVYNAEGMLRDMIDGPIAIVSGRRLLVHGVRLDKVLKLGDEAIPALFDTSVEMSWAPQDDQKLYEVTGEPMLRAYFRTLIADVKILRQADSKVVSRADDTVWPEKLHQMDDLKNITQHSRVNAHPFNTMKDSTTRRRYARTEKEHIGLVPSHTEIGDEIVALRGGQVLYVLRALPNQGLLSSDDSMYKFVGESYLHGGMDGEAVRVAFEKGGELCMFILE